MFSRTSMRREVLRNKILIAIAVFIIVAFFASCRMVAASEVTTTGKINISINELSYTDIAVNNISGFKSYMGYKSITKTSSPQYVLQQFCTTDKDGFRRCNDKYVIAVGSGVGGRVGDVVDLVLQNGQVIECVIGDYKDNKHTDAANLICKNGCCSEFIVDMSALRNDIKTLGNVSCGYPGWNSPVAVIRRYVMNYLGGK